MQEELTAYLLAASSPVQLVAGDRVHWGVSPQGTANPRLVLTKIDGDPVASDEGDSGLIASRVQVDCYGDTYASAQQLARAVKTMLSGKFFVAGSVDFQGIWLDGERDFPETKAGGGVLHRTSLDLFSGT